MIKRAALLGIVMLTMASGAHPQSATVRVSGRAIDSSGAILPGVTVTLTGPSTRRAVTDADGSYVFTDLMPGYYTLTGTLAGFQTASRAVVAAAPGSFAVDLTLRLGCLSEIDRVDFGLPTNIAAADAVLYVRITDAGRRARLTSNDYCVEGREHQAIVLDVIKSPRLGSDMIRLVRAGPTSYRPGDEVVVFLHRHPSGAFIDFGDYTFPVTDGRVRWWRDDLPGVTDGSPVRQVLEGLRNTLSMIR
jgi:hypothetical protein